MPTQTQTILPLALRTNFVQASPAVNVPVGLLAARFRMESTEFTTPDLTCQFEMEETNNGIDWRFVAGQNPFLGGTLKNGQPVLPSMRVTFNDDATQIRGTITTQGSWTWALVVDLET